MNQTVNKTLEIRTAETDDQPQILRLIDEIYREYGDRICVDGAESDVMDIQQNYLSKGGMFWVLVDATGNILGSHAAFPKHESVDCGFRRLYLKSQLRGTDWGHQLMQIAIRWARERGYRRIEFWSDTRFERAHAFFAKFGFRRDGRTRTMQDGHQPYREYYFSLDL